MILSHKNPSKPLWDESEGHLQEVYTGMQNIFFSLNLTEDYLSEEKTNLYCKIIGYCHDIGKATSYFQNKLSGNEIFGEPSNHSKIGAAFAWYICEQLKLSENESLLIYRLIFCHHSSPHKSLEDLMLSDNDKNDILMQLENILVNLESKNIFNKIWNLFIREDFSKQSFKEFINNIPGKLTKRSLDISIETKLSEEKSKQISLYFILFSVFSKADKYNALFRRPWLIDRKERLKNTKKISDKLIGNYKEIKQKENPVKYRETALNKLRQKFYLDIEKSITKISLDKEHIFYVEAPTGIGKTFTLFNAAIKLKNKIFQDKGKIYRIIYSLPFLSIIDQTSNTIQDILSKNGIDITTDIFLEYHHLADTTTRKIDNNEFQYEDEEALMLNRFWDSEIILTTFVSFIETFARGENLIKFANICNSIIILDEVQAIDSGLYPYVKWFIQILIRYFNCYVILTTATMPEIFKQGSKNLYYNNNLKNKLYYSLNRYSVNLLPEMNINKFIIYLKKYLKDNPTESVLVVANTKKMAYQIAKKLNQEYKDNLFYLTTLTIPILRKQIINNLKKKLEIDRQIIISTQLIEAGVDISVNTIFKFLSPFDSILQAAGRVNRNYELGEKKGKIFVVNIFNENDTPSYTGVYLKNTERHGGDIKINFTKKLFNKNFYLEEKEILHECNKFFNKLRLKNFWNEIQKDLKNENFKEFGEKIKIISTELGKFTVFIDIEVKINKEKIKSIDIYNQYLKIKNKKVKTKEELFKKRLELKKMQKDFSEFCISITNYEARNLPELGDINETKYVPLLNQESYDLKLGLKVFESIENKNIFI